MSMMEIETTPVQYPVKQSASPPAPLLPPCRVCGEKASGFHYGANTCEACKGFFRRSLQRKEDYKCLASGSCNIAVGRRNACAYCRWKKCLAVGMSKTAIKTGRYTHEKKTKDIEEVKRLQRREKMKGSDSSGEESMSMSTPPSLSPAQEPPQETSEEELEKIIQHITSIHRQQTPHTPEFFEKLPEKEKEFLEQRELQRKMFGTMKPIPREEYMQIYQSTGIDIDGRREMIKHMIPCIEKAIKRFITFAKALPGFKDLPIDDQIALIKGSRFETFLISSHKAFNAEHGLYTHVCGYTLDVHGLSKVHTEEYIDSVFRVADRINKLNLTVEEECVIRGITILSRVNKCDTWIIMAHKRFNSEKMIYCSILNDRMYHLDDFALVESRESWQRMFQLSGMLKRLNLSLEESCMMAAVNMLMADRCTLSCTAEIEKSLQLCLECLLYLLRKNHSDQPFAFPNIVAALTELRRVSHHIEKDANGNLQKVSWAAVDVPPIVCELWSTN